MFDDISEEQIQLFVKCGQNGNAKVVHLKKDSPVTELFKIVADCFRFPEEGLRLIYGNKEVRPEKDGKSTNLQSYGIEDESNLFIVVRQPGGSDVRTLGFGNWMKNFMHRSFETEVDRQQKRFEEYLTTEEGSNVQNKQRFQSFLKDGNLWANGTDPIAADSNPKIPKAKLPCGHVIRPDSLYDHCKSTIKEGNAELTCWECGAVLQFSTVKKLAALTKEEKKSFEELLAINFMKSKIRVKQCPRCKCDCERKDMTNIRVLCLNCRNNGHYFEFCWECQTEWASNANGGCGSKSCSQKWKSSEMPKEPSGVHIERDARSDGLKKVGKVITIFGGFCVCYTLVCCPDELYKNIHAFPAVFPLL